MSWKGFLSSLGCLAAPASSASAQVFHRPGGYLTPQPNCPTPIAPDSSSSTTPPNVPVPQPGQPAQPGADAFAQAPEGGTQPAASFNPGMFGDQLGTARNNSSSSFAPTVTINGVTTNLTPGQQVPTNLIVQGAVFNFTVFFNPGNGSPTLTIPAGTPLPAAVANSPNFINGLIAPSSISNTNSGSSFRDARVGTAVALLSRGAFKIAENESPRPMDRVFVNYNHFDKVLGSVSLDRETVGFEKTFLGGNASFGLRVPVFQLGGDSTAGIGAESAVGDLTLIGKYALINNPDTGNVVSTGLALTLPTGPNIGFPGIHDTLIQPYVGGIYNLDRAYVHGFMSVVVPTDGNDCVQLFTDFGVGYKLYQGEGCDHLLTAVIPTFEVHLNDPLSHRGVASTPFGFDDLVDLTYGMTFGIGQQSTLGLGLVTPVTGPKPFNVEGQVQFNWRF